MHTVTVDPKLAKDLLSDALDRDAAGGEADAPAPPKAPWLHEDGTAKYGYKADGTPRKSRPGSGRPPKDEGARITGKLPAAAAADGPRTATAGPGGGGRDYAGDVSSALTMAWMGMAAVPPTRAHAAVLAGQIPRLSAAWGTAAEHNASIRGYVEKLSGEGSFAWVIPVTLATANLGVAMLQVTRDPELRAQLAEQTERDFTSFLSQQLGAQEEIPADGAPADYASPPESSLPPQP